MRIRWFRLSVAAIFLIIILVVGMKEFQKYQFTKSRNKVIAQMDKLMAEKNGSEFRRLEKVKDGVEIISYIPKTATKEDNKTIQNEVNEAIDKAQLEKAEIIFYTFQKRKLVKNAVSYKVEQYEYVKEGQTKLSLQNEKDICKNLVTDAETGNLLTLENVLQKSDETKVKIKTAVEQELIKSGDIPLKDIGVLGEVKSIAKWTDTNFGLTDTELILPIEVPGYLKIKKVNLKLADIADLVNKRYLPADIKVPATPKAKAGKKIALTFDDGPSASVTPKVLETLKRNKVKATFFVLGSQALQNPGLVKRELNDGHQVGSHSWDHPQLTKLSKKEVYDQVLKTQKVIFDQTGYFPTTVRPPYGAVNKEVAEEMGLPIIQWSVDTEDWKNKNPKIITSKIMASASDGAIVLMHDIHSTTEASLDKTIKLLKKQGYQFVTINELFSEKLQVGKQYFDESEARIVK
ncbi:polysaccharide deacetylase family protein [Listeria sp. FSL L7-1509]|uniref:Polysaccharide deacetylase family protein n=1 Tax=Listeria immobilis TaxID=2713502 RepID=A0ABR6ST68_9LIST|nr:polysaccharide deacetylase family protein [Listeria immobilis]MBC1482715.1 polysaccharide deacetylase family protein [Listeria immobilis]MBC1506071.1 polysaccharide deacetylase family protein [Listeria immobilis]MBC1508715.1 polysaccharide deacetylase family protein [Listeria immobilis]MBC6303077.1 polysaccharide deacetylase family protein [Listeria immobilis]MBC6311428.1 polysaccharide deacetylase family protein [Listeria immobilis]